MEDGSITSLQGKAQPVRYEEDVRPPRNNYFEVVASKMQRDLERGETLDAPQEPALSRILHDASAELPVKSPRMLPPSQGTHLQRETREQVRIGPPVASPQQPQQAAGIAPPMLPLNAPSQGLFRAAPQKQSYIGELETGPVFPVDISPEAEGTNVRNLGLPSLSYSTHAKAPPTSTAAERSEGSQEQSVWQFGSHIDMCRSEKSDNELAADGMCKSGGGADDRSNQLGINYKEGERPSAEMLFTGGSGSQVLVGYVAPGSKAQRAGVIEGCALLAINETAAGVFNHLPGWHVRMMLRAPCWLYFEKKAARPQGPSEIRVKNLRDAPVGLAMSMQIVDSGAPTVMAEQAVFQTDKGPLWLQVGLEDDSIEKTEVGGHGVGNAAGANVKSPVKNSRSRNTSPVYEVRRREAKELISNALRLAPVSPSTGSLPAAQDIGNAQRTDFLPRENSSQFCTPRSPMNSGSGHTPLRWGSPPFERSSAVSERTGLSPRPRQNSPRPSQARGDVGVQRLLSCESEKSEKSERLQEQGDEGSVKEIAPMPSASREAPVRIFPRSSPVGEPVQSLSPKSASAQLPGAGIQAFEDSGKIRKNSPFNSRPMGDDASPEDIVQEADDDSARNRLHPHQHTVGTI